MTIPVHFGMGHFGAFDAANPLSEGEARSLLPFANHEPEVTRWPFAARVAVIVGGAVVSWAAVLAPVLWIAAHLR